MENLFSKYHDFLQPLIYIRGWLYLGLLLVWKVLLDFKNGWLVYQPCLKLVFGQNCQADTRKFIWYNLIPDFCGWGIDEVYEAFQDKVIKYANVF